MLSAEGGGIYTFTYEVTGVIAGGTLWCLGVAGVTIQSIADLILY